MSGAPEVGWVVRYVAYAVAAAVSALLVATISQDRLLRFANVPAAAGFALLLGLALFAVALALRRFPALAGCGSYAVAGLVVAMLVYSLSGLAAPGMRVTFAGSLVGALLAMAAGGAVYSLLDEPPGNQARSGSDG